MNSTIFAGKKVALVHDWLNGMRGGEKCLEVFCELFPQADLYTLFHEAGKLSPLIESRPIATSFIQKLPGVFSKYRYYLPLFPRAIEDFDLSAYDLILSSSHCVAKGVKHNGTPYHVSYLHTPMRYMWDLFEVYFGKQRAAWWVHYAAKACRPYLQHWDENSSKRVHRFLCNSNNVRQRILRIYGREACVIYPPVDLSQFQATKKKKEYYLMVGAFAPNKRVDLAVAAFNLLKLPLVIVGTGPEEAHCKSMAQPNISFLGNVSNETIGQLYGEAKAFLFPGEDDFGITPLEAQASGTPVIAYGKGGALETVTEKTGIFFQQPTVGALCEAVQQMEKERARFTLENCVQQAQKFNRARYKQQILQAVEEGYCQWQGGRAGGKI